MVETAENEQKWGRGRPIFHQKTDFESLKGVLHSKCSPIVYLEQPKFYNVLFNPSVVGVGWCWDKASDSILALAVIAINKIVWTETLGQNPLASFFHFAVVFKQDKKSQMALRGAQHCNIQLPPKMARLSMIIE